MPSKPKCIDEQIGHLITFYEFDQLSEEEKIVFETHILDCDFCRSELRQMNSTFDLLHGKSTAILQALKVPETGSSSTPLIDRLMKFVRGIFQSAMQPEFATAAVVTVILCIFLLTLGSPPPGSHYVEFLSFDKAPYHQQVLRTIEDTTATEHFKRGMAYYQNNEYQNAATELQKVLALEPQNGLTWLYLGVCYYLTKDSNSAIASLKKAVELNGNVLLNRSRWYLAQSYMLSNDVPSARTQLELLVAEQLEYSKEAETLLQKLNH